jgi:hypothetical protein
VAQGARRYPPGNGQVSLQYSISSNKRPWAFIFRSLLCWKKLLNKNAINSNFSFFLLKRAWGAFIRRNTIFIWWVCLC